MNTTEITEKYLREHPSIKDCLKNNVINYSKLSRKIAKDLNIEKETSIEAILIACRRYAQKLKKETVRENKIIQILKNSELQIKNKIIVAIVEKTLYKKHLVEIEKKIRNNADTFYAIEGTTVFTIIVSEKYENDLQTLFKKNIKKVTKDLAMITIKSPEELETTTGVLAYLVSLFGDNGVNIQETLSCWTDTIFLVEENDVATVMKFLRF
jgi:hypothetical protein